MAESTYRFRTSLRGFHKGDVTAYIEKTASLHRSEMLEREQKICALQEENRSLQQQLNLLMMATPVVTPAPAPVCAPEPVAEPEPIAEPAPAPIPEPAAQPAPDALELMHQELLAYRRAEAVERNANNRARQLYEKMEDLCGDTLGDFQAADAAVKQTIEIMTAQAASLEEAYQALSAALAASREKLASLNKSYSVPDSID